MQAIAVETLHLSMQPSLTKLGKPIAFSSQGCQKALSTGA